MASGIPGQGGTFSSGPIAAFILAGKTGSGKSSFIKLLGGKDLAGCDPVVDGGLDSCTKMPTSYTTVLENRKILLLDTPGFDDSAVENLEILNDIVANLYTFALRNQDIEMRGVIFLHDISETRFSGSQKKTLEILKALCGPRGMRNCIIGTTMWNTPGTNKFRNEERRERDFLRIHWKEILKTTRLAEDDRDAVVRVIKDILARPKILLLVQEEMLKPPHTLANTTIGKIAIPEGQAEAERIKKEYEEYKKQSQEEKKAQEEEFKRQYEETRRKNAEEQARREEEYKQRERERDRREDERQRQHQEYMRNLMEEQRQRAEETEQRRRAESERREWEERRRWEEYTRQERERAERAERENEERRERERERQRREEREEAEREERRRERYEEQQRRANASPPPPSGFWEKLTDFFFSW